jgi:hypothetical protein
MVTAQVESRPSARTIHAPAIVADGEPARVRGEHGSFRRGDPADVCVDAIVGVQCSPDRRSA